MTTQYWLVKQEPEDYSWDDFVRDGRTTWSGVRNYAARLNLRAMQPGDSVLFYTDGVTEAHSPDGELFGTDRLADLAGQHASNQVEPEGIVRLLTRAVIDHRRADLADDVTMVLVRWNGPTRGSSPTAP